MNYSVAWTQAAQAQLTAVWIRAVNRPAIGGYSLTIDRSLGRDPSDYGESRDEGTRLAFFRPLAVRYHVDEVTRKVTVLSLRWVGR